MATNNPLLVPLETNAMVINNAALAHTGVRLMQWQFHYTAMQMFQTPQPDPFLGFGNMTKVPGVLVRWELPDIIRHGTQTTDGDMTYPLVPNRWLVVRYSGPPAARKAVGWVVESDTLGNSDPITGGSAYMDPFDSEMQATLVGQVVALDGYTATEQPRLFLTAIAPGNVMFASYAPYHWNVFSMFDPMDGVDEVDQVSYFIGGWYSDPSADITGSWQQNGTTFQEFLDSAGWQLAQPSDDTATWAIYQGLVWNVQWNLKGDAPSNVPATSDVNMALGNNAVEALTAMLQNQYQHQQDVSMLEAFQHSLLSMLDKQDAPYDIKEQLKAAAYGYSYGGYGWDIVNATSTNDAAPDVDAAEAVKEAEWLAELNNNQQALEVATRELNDLQQQLYQVWYKYNLVIYFLRFTSPPPFEWPDGTSEEQFLDALDPDQDDSLVTQVYNQIQLVATLQQSVPFGATQDALQEQVQKYAASKDLPDTRILKQYAKRPFCQPLDPVLLFNGLHNQLPLAPSEPVTVRFIDEVVTGINFQGKDITVTDVRSAISLPAGIARVPGEMQALLDEQFFLDPLNATMIVQTYYGNNNPDTINALYAAMEGGKQVNGICPDFSLTPWTQPWEPLVLLWDIVYYPIPHDDADAPVWTFNGNDYTWNGKGIAAIPENYTYKGMIFLSTQASFNFQAQLDKLAIEYPNNDKIEWLQQFISSVDDWDFLSQSLMGLTPFLKRLVSEPNVSPSADDTVYYNNLSLSDLLGVNTNYQPDPGITTPPDYHTEFPPSGFQPWRAGQFYLDHITVVDKYGQALEIVTGDNNKLITPVAYPTLVPQYPVLQHEPYRLVQLPPRLLQPARLNLDFVAADNDAHLLGYSPGTNPICAWLLHNILDQSIACYDAVGKIIGAVSLVYNAQSVQEVHWEPAPGSAYPTVQSLINTAELNHLGTMLQGLQTAGAAAFTGLLATMDQAAVTIDGVNTSTDAGLILLAGKPIALVRMRTQFELDAALATDPSWRFTFDTDPNPLPNWRFNIKLGNTAQRDDGLIGYFFGSDYDVFYSDSIPDKVQMNYLQPIGTGDSVQLCFDGSAVLLTVLMDPRGSLHAFTGLLPVMDAVIPQEFVTPAFAAMDLNFHVGPLLSELVIPGDTTADTEVPASLVLPAPRLKNGTWLWNQAQDNNWITYTLSPASGTAQFSNSPVVIREGLMVLKGGVTT
jgi:hypothetical protein